MATCNVQAGTQTFSIKINRPNWEDVYNGYPKNKDGTDDMETTEVFKLVFGDNYDTKTKTFKDPYTKDEIIMANACATRVSIALNKAGMSVAKNFTVLTGELKGKGLVTSAISLKKWLSEDTVWGKADEIIKGPTNLTDVAAKINCRNGVYILIPKAGYWATATGHATLWIGADGDVVGGHDYADGAGEIYFWELKSKI